MGAKSFLLFLFCLAVCAQQVFPTIEQTYDFLNSLTTSIEESKLSNFTIGKSFDKRDIHAFCVGNCISNSPQVLLTGLHHAREVRSTVDETFVVLKKN